MARQRSNVVAFRFVVINQFGPRMILTARDDLMLETPSLHQSPNWTAPRSISNIEGQRMALALIREDIGPHPPAQCWLCG